jgi:hypothetical protein
LIWFKNMILVWIANIFMSILVSLSVNVNSRCCGDFTILKVMLPLSSH